MSPSIVPISLVNWYAGDYTSTTSTLRISFSTNPTSVWSTGLILGDLSPISLSATNIIKHLHTASLLRHPLQRYPAQGILGGLFQFHGFGFKISHPFLKEVLPPDNLTPPNLRWDMLKQSICKLQQLDLRWPGWKETLCRLTPRPEIGKLLQKIECRPWILKMMTLMGIVCGDYRFMQMDWYMP